MDWRDSGEIWMSDENISRDLSLFKLMKNDDFDERVMEETGYFL